MNYDGSHVRKVVYNDENTVQLLHSTLFCSQRDLCIVVYDLLNLAFIPTVEERLFFVLLHAQYVCTELAHGIPLRIQMYTR